MLSFSCQGCVTTELDYQLGFPLSSEVPAADAMGESKSCVHAPGTCEIRSVMQSHASALETGREDVSTSRRYSHANAEL